MHFIRTGLNALLALSSFSATLALPTFDADNALLIPDNAALAALKGRGLGLLIPDDNALAALTARDEGLEKRNGPPGYADFVKFFESTNVKPWSGNTCFWSGIGEAGSTAFAQANGRMTLEMLINTYMPSWKTYMNDKQNGGHWNTFDDAREHFFTPASQAYAEWATGTVFFAARLALVPQYDQSNPACQTCWRVTEKPAVLAGLANGRVHQIQMYVDGKFSHYITSMDTK